MCHHTAELKPALCEPADKTRTTTVLGMKQQALQHLTHQGHQGSPPARFARRAFLTCHRFVLQTWHSLIPTAQEAEGSDPVVDGDNDDSAPVGHLLPVVQRVSQDGHVVGRPQQEGPSEQVDHHCQVGGHCWRNRRDRSTSPGWRNSHRVSGHSSVMLACLQQQQRRSLTAS